jgi:hypothetical protein
MTLPDCRHGAASKRRRRRRHQTGYVPQAEGGFGPDTYFMCYAYVNLHSTIFQLMFSGGSPVFYMF